jgi:hypothetical protein
MANRLLTQAGWKAVLTKNNAVKDNGLLVALARYEKYPEEATSERRDALDQVIRLAGILQKDKAVATLPVVLKYLRDVATAGVNERQQIAKDLGKIGMRTIDIQVMALNWEGVPMNGYLGVAEFKSPGTPTVALKQDIQGGVVSFKGVSLAKSGTLRFIAAPRSPKSLFLQGLIDYTLPSQSIMKFQATQETFEIRKRAKSSKEATEKAGLKGTAGIDFKIVSVGGEKTSESERKDAYEEEVEFVIKAGKPALKLKKL